MPMAEAEVENAFDNGVATARGIERAPLGERCSLRGPRIKVEAKELVSGGLRDLMARPVYASGEQMAIADRPVAEGIQVRDQFAPLGAFRVAD